MAFEHPKSSQIRRHRVWISQRILWVAIISHSVHNNNDIAEKITVIRAPKIVDRIFGSCVVFRYLSMYANARAFCEHQMSKYKIAGMYLTAVTDLRLSNPPFIGKKFSFLLNAKVADSK